MQLLLRHLLYIKALKPLSTRFTGSICFPDFLGGQKRLRLQLLLTSVNQAASGPPNTGEYIFPVIESPKVYGEQKSMIVRIMMRQKVGIT